MATSVRRSKTERVYCMDCSSGAAFSPWSERTGPTATSSWDEDFYTSAAAQVQQTLEAIDGYLYEESDNEPGSSVLNGELKLECERWKQQFPHLRVTGRRLASPTAAVTKSIILNGGSTSTESKCNSETSWSAEEEMLKKKVIDHLCAIFWPEVHLWLEMSYQHPAHEPLSPRHLHWDFDKEVHDCQGSLEGVLTVTPKLLRDRFSERACSSTTFSSRYSTAQSTHKQGSRQQGLCEKQQWQHQLPVASRCTSRLRPLLPPLSSGSNGSSSSKVPMSSLSSRSDRTSSGSSTSKLPPINPASLQSMYVKGHRINVSERPLSRSVNSCCRRPRAEK